MTSIAKTLERTAHALGLMAADEKLTAASAFALVRDMPYQRASSREPEAIVREWKGTCSGKHYLLDGVFRELGMDSRIVMCTHRFTRENTTHFPEALRSLVAAEPVPDVHTYIRLKTDAKDG